MSNNKKSDLPLEKDNGKGYTEVKINPVGAVVKSIVMIGDHDFRGVQFFDKDNVKILEAGDMFG